MNDCIRRSHEVDKTHLTLLRCRSDSPLLKQQCQLHSSPESEQGPKFRIAICGAGIAGLVLAITIGKYDPLIPIDLYEARDSIDTIGAGITLWRQTHDVMTELGLFDDFKHILTHDPESVSGPTVRRADIPEGGYVWYHRIHRYGASAMHRHDMVAILEKHIPLSCTVHPRKRLVSYVEPEEQDANSTSPIVLHFTDGTTSTTDVLIGADGVRSETRKIMFEKASKEDVHGETDLEQYIDATFTGMSAYRCTIPAETLRKEDPENISLTEMLGFVGKGAYLATYPIAKGTIINVVGIIGNPSLMGTHYKGPWVTDTTRDEMTKYFNNFEPGVRTVVGLCGKPSKWALHVVKPLPFWVRRKVALVGDACHATTPHFGAGGGQAIEDGFVLGRLIAHPLATLSCIRDVLRIYEETRLPFAREVARISLSTGWMQSFMEPGYYDGTRKDEDLDDRGIGAYEREGMETLGQEMHRRWDWIEESRGALGTWEEAESKLRALVAN